MSHDQKFEGFQDLDSVSGLSRDRQGRDDRRGGSLEFFSSGLPAPAAPPWWSSGCWSASPGNRSWSRSWSSSRTPPASSTSPRRPVTPVLPLSRATCREPAETNMREQSGSIICEYTHTTLYYILILRYTIYSYYVILYTHTIYSYYIILYLVFTFYVFF